MLTSPRPLSIDLLGQWLSSLCVVHCLCTPLLLGLLPAAGAAWLEGELLHGSLATAVLLCGSAALLPGYRRHRARMPLLAGMLGAAALVAGVLAGEERPVLEACATALGSALFVLAHARNRTLCRACCA